ncbi:MAG: RHS repeat-associated core domain-containing protein [Bacillota bacterium]|nr:RHS repeat-associated core domain-containing protein [Bacillota bacterium]
MLLESNSFTYDSNGNTLSKTDSTGTTLYEYNSNNQLTKVTQPNGDVIQYAYDGDNKRISKTVNGAVTKYVYDGDQVSEETDASGNVEARYVYDDKGTPVSVTVGGKVYNYQYNGHGDVVALTDSNGNAVATYTYDVWGNVTDKTGNIDNLFGYAGQYGYVYDQETGFYFLKSRYYDPKIGRFTTKDRFEGFEDRPSSQNQYTFCEDDSINHVDPSGYSTIKIVIRPHLVFTDLENYGTAALVWYLSYQTMLTVGRAYGFSRYSERGTVVLTATTMVLGGVIGGWVSRHLNKNINISIWIPFLSARTIYVG